MKRITRVSAFILSVVMLTASLCFSVSATDELQSVADSMVQDLSHPELDDYEKALLLHDRLIAHCDYTDDSGCDSKQDALIGKKANSYGYAAAYGYLLERVGIESRVFESKNIGRAWNIVYINDKAYNVDAAYDDGYPAEQNRVGHKAFLQSSKYFKTAIHKDADCDPEATDNSYIATGWHNTDTQAIHINGLLYRLNFHFCEIQGNTVYELFGDNVKYLVSYLPYHYVLPEMSVIIDKNLFYYSHDSRVFVYDYNTKSNMLLWTPDIDGIIIDITLDGDVLKCSYTEKYPDVKEVSVKFSTLTPKPIPEPEKYIGKLPNDKKWPVFTDVVSGKWYSNAVWKTYTMGIMAGVRDDYFDLNGTLTRGMFITMLARLAEADTPNSLTNRFSDVSEGRYYTNAIKWASNNGIASGVSDTEFEPERAITRQEICTMLMNFADAFDIEFYPKEGEGYSFSDSAEIAGWAKKAVDRCELSGIISGYNEGGNAYFKPRNTATRAEAAQIMYMVELNHVTKITTVGRRYPQFIS